MKERLEKFIKTEGLTPSRFAEIMGVQPSSISHILGGRNKPSFDFIEKMLLRFPKINPDWLLLGKGPIYRLADTVSFEPAPPAEDQARPGGPMTQSATLPFESAPTAPIPAAVPVPPSPEQARITPRTEADTPTGTASRTAAASVQQAFPHISEEQIERIVVFLKDKTFVSYRPK